MVFQGDTTSTTAEEKIMLASPECLTPNAAIDGGMWRNLQSWIKDETSLCSSESFHLHLASLLPLVGIPTEGKLKWAYVFLPVSNMLE